MDQSDHDDSDFYVRDPDETRGRIYVLSRRHGDGDPGGGDGYDGLGRGDGFGDGADAYTVAAGIGDGRGDGGLCVTRCEAPRYMALTYGYKAPKYTATVVNGRVEYTKKEGQ